MLLLLGDDAAIGQTFNVGSPNEISILDLAKLIIARSGSTSAIELIPYDQAYESGFEDMERRVPDTAKLRAYTGLDGPPLAGRDPGRDDRGSGRGNG